MKRWSFAWGSALLRAFVDTLSPPTCAACDAATAGRVVFCRACALSVVRAPPSRVAHGYGSFGGALAIAIRRFKYASRADLARPLGDLLRAEARASSLSADSIIPVPLHPRRLAERGYNQAALIARPLARELSARFAFRALERTRDTPHQASLDRADRLGNVAGAFRVRSADEVEGKRVLLVDDVATTGATLDACAAALVGAGARAVTRLVVARA